MSKLKAHQIIDFSSVGIADYEGTLHLMLRQKHEAQLHKTTTLKKMSPEELIETYTWTKTVPLLCALGFMRR